MMSYMRNSVDWLLTLAVLTIKATSGTHIALTTTDVIELQQNILLHPKRRQENKRTNDNNQISDFLWRRGIADSTTPSLRSSRQFAATFKKVYFLFFYVRVVYGVNILYFI